MEQKAGEAQGLSLRDVAVLSSVKSPDLLQELFEKAREVKDAIYGNRLVLFAPLYLSNLCSNECLYCAFRASNKLLKRRALLQDEIKREVTNLVEQGQKRLLLVAGESNTKDEFKYILDSIKTVYSVKSKHGEIRRVNVNIAPLTLDHFKELKDAQIGTYQLFQETYDPKVYDSVHISGKKKDYNWRLTAIDRAMQAKIDDVGIGVLFGLAPWRFELLALLQHASYLESEFGVGPHTISVPRLEPATGSSISSNPPNPVSDEDFKKIIAILRLAIPFVGIILSTRESPEIRREALKLGVSQISAGSRTNPGGYSEDEEGAEDNTSQFSLGDHRSVDDVIYDIASLGYIPSFCTACYRLKRTGERFMDFAKSGKIKTLCIPNALATFEEYLVDYASLKTKEIGEKLIDNEISRLGKDRSGAVIDMIKKIKSGQRDIYC